MDKIKKAKLKDLIQDDRNMNKGTERGQQLIEKSLREFGAGRSLLLDKNNRIIAGNKTHKNAEALGKYYFAYIPDPNGQILGISKVARVVGYCSARLQLQERLARDIVNMLNDALKRKVQGMAIVMRGTHLCKTMRGVRNNGQMTVSYLSGIFKENNDARQEFYKLIEIQEKR